MRADPRNEYSRECPYCEELFIADHMSRKYCPEKNGIKNYCKNRYKRLKDSGAIDNQTMDEIPEKSIDEIIREMGRERDLLILQKILGEQPSVTIPDQQLKDLHFNFNNYDKKQKAKSGHYIFHIGEYVYIPLNDSISIMYKSKLEII